MSVRRITVCDLLHVRIGVIGSHLRGVLSLLLPHPSVERPELVGELINRGLAVPFAFVGVLAEGGEPLKDVPLVTTEVEQLFLAKFLSRLHADERRTSDVLAAHRMTSCGGSRSNPDTNSKPLYGGTIGGSTPT